LREGKEMRGRGVEGTDMGDEGTGEREKKEG